MFNNLFFVLKSIFLEFGYNFVMLCLKNEKEWNDLFLMFKCNDIYMYYCFLYLINYKVY